MKTVHKDVLELPTDFENSIGLFAWARVGARCDFDKAKVFVCDGAAFGCPGFARINLGIRPDVLKEAVNRLNGN
jgi:bifunctional pyridoxal-dependent enzyme with beta-cystathionase and maltose regulon repressor activities